MRNRVPAAGEERAPLPDFAPVPRKFRHDGWTPERQKAFIEALADCGSVSRAAAQVNMAQANCYTLRRAPGAEAFRRAWDAALDFGVKRLKDIAFERAIEGQLHPVFANGKLMGFSRRRNDALLMFCLRHYGHDGEGRRTTVNYFSTRASAGAASGPEASSGGAATGAEASTTTVRTVISGGGAAVGAGRAEAALNDFAGVALDGEAQAAIAAALEACAARARAAEGAVGEDAADWAEGDADEPYVSLPHNGTPYRGELLAPAAVEEWAAFGGDEAHWHQAGAEMPEWAAEALAAADGVGPDGAGPEARAALCDNSAVAPARAKEDTARDGHVGDVG
ncbi:MAG: hypothetical protein ABIP41_06605 [Croceibacterium sp.]